MGKKDDNIMRCLYMKVEMYRTFCTHVSFVKIFRKFLLVLSFYHLIISSNEMVLSLLRSNK